ncbi:MAG: haloacid dehalogenase-like hydrolase [Acidimicrobiales bacterium]
MDPGDVLVLFDIDGTLVRAGDPAHHEAFDDALVAVFGVPASIAGVPLAGRLDHQIAADALAAHGVDEAEVAARLPQLAEAMGAGYAARVAPGARVARRLPGVPATLDRLVAAGIVLGIVTGNCEPVGRAKLVAAGIDDRFGPGGWGDHPVDRAGLVERARAAAAAQHGRDVRSWSTWVVGDTPLDVEAAHRAGARALAVPTGVVGREQLAAAGPDELLDDLADAEAVLAALLEVPGRAG